MSAVDSVSIERGGELILETIGSVADLTLVRAVDGPGGELAAAGAGALLSGREYREIGLDELASARGHTALLLGGAFSRAHPEVLARALAVAELRFERVIVLPSSFDPSEDVVRAALERTEATVFASEPESLRQIGPLCAAQLAHDCSFFFDYAPYRREGNGTLNAFRTDREGTPGLRPPPGNHDPSESDADVSTWLETIAAHELVRTDDANTMIAAALLGKRVEFAPGSYHRLRGIAEHSLAEQPLTAIEVSDDDAGAAALTLPATVEATLDQLRARALATPAETANQPRDHRVTAVILTRNRPAYMARALASLRESEHPVQTIVIDNNSAPSDARVIASVCANSPDTELERWERNLGCAGGRRLAAEMVDTEFILFLDDDAEALPGAIDHLISEMERDRDAVAAVATVMHPNGTIFYSGGSMHVMDEIVNFGLLGDGLHLDEAQLPPSGPSDWVPLGAVLIRRAVLDRYPFDPFMGYFGDNEWSYRVGAGRPGSFRRCREALVLHHSPPKPVGRSDFAARSSTAELLTSYARFYRLHGRLLGPWLFDHVPELRAADGSCDLPAARLLMELMIAKGSDWVFAAWMNGDLSGLLSANRRLVELQQLQQSRDAERIELAALRARAALDAYTISTLSASLTSAKRSLLRVERSVIWQLFQRVRGRVFAILGGEDSPAVQALQRFLRLAGRSLSIARATTSESRSPPLVRGRAGSGPIWLARSDHPDVSLVIPLYAHSELTRAALESVRDHTQNVDYEVILVDDAADSETKSLLREVHGAQLIVNDANQGYMNSIRRGAAAAKGRWLVLCNNDIEVQPGWLPALLDCGESRPDVAIVAPKFLYPDGTLAEAGGIVWSDGTGANYGRGDDPGVCHYEYRRQIDYGSAAALLVRKDFWQEVGGFDDRFLPMYYEDTDLCFEARARGLRVMFEPQARVIHLEGATAGVDESAGHKRHQEANRPKFVEKWQDVLEREHLPNDRDNLWAAANLRRSPRVLVIDHRIPMWDRESGALRMRGIVEALLDLGCHVTFLPDNLVAHQRYALELQRLGVEVLYDIKLPGELKRIGPGLALAILSRPDVAGRWLQPVRDHAPDAAVVYDTVDLHWLREARRTAQLGGAAVELNGGSLSPKAATMRELELSLIRATDATIVVSESERVQVLKDVPEARVHVVPNVNEVRAYVPSADHRRGVIFVGGFEHSPNVDAALVLVRDVMPAVWRELGDVPVTIVGADPPPEVAALSSPLVSVRGWVADLDSLLDSSRVLVAPLTYGAGVKGKVTQALGAGLPVVTTPIGAEGLDAVDGEHLMIGHDASELAARVIQLMTDREVWARLSTAGQALAAERFSPSLVTDRLGQLLTQLPASADMVGNRQSGRR